MRAQGWLWLHISVGWTMIEILVEEWVVEGWHGEIKKIKYTVSSFFKPRVNEEKNARNRFFF